MQKFIVIVALAFVLVAGTVALMTHYPEHQVP
jgi:hypothetical protein